MITPISMPNEITINGYECKLLLQVNEIGLYRTCEQGRGRYFLNTYGQPILSCYRVGTTNEITKDQVKTFLAAMNPAKRRPSGLLDKNQNPIYENDMVCVHLSTGIVAECKVEFNDGCFEVVADGNIFQIRENVYSSRDYLKCYTGNHAVEIITKKSDPCLCNKDNIKIGS